MKTIIFVIAFLVSIAALAQDCEDFALLKKGTEFEYSHFNSKNKLESINKTKVLDVNKTGNVWTIKTENASYDGKDKEFYKWQQEYNCQDGTLTFDLQHLFNNKMMSEYNDMEVKVVSDQLELPSKLHVGQKLNDGTASISVNSNGISILNMSMKISNRMVEGKESTTVPAGTFDCYVITYDVETKNIFKSLGKNKEWHAKEIGMVKQESYDSKGNLVGYTVLNALKK